MTNYRPITDTWILARPKLLDKETYYGAYPAGFLQRGRDMIGCGLDQKVLHVCGGQARKYPYRGFGYNDKTMDIDLITSPDFLRDARDPWPDEGWEGIIADPPYSPEEASNYSAGSENYPKPVEILKRAAEVLRPGKRIGILHYLWVPPIKNIFRPIAIITVLVGCNNRGRLYSVFERL